MEQKVLYNDKLANQNFVTIEKNEALISTESKLNSLRLDQLSTETSKLQKLIIGQFLSLRMIQANQDYHIKLQSEVLIYYDKLNNVALSLLETENIISQIFSLTETLQCSLLDDKQFCYTPSKSHIKKDDISFNIILHHQNPESQDLVFINCAPLDNKLTSFLDWTHGILLNNTIMINDREMVSINDLENDTLIYSKTKPISNLIQNNLILLKDGQKTGFYCFKPDVFIQNQNIFNCSTKIFWTTLQSDDQIISSKGTVYVHHNKDLKLKSRKSFHDDLRKVSNIENVVLNSVFEDNVQPWHHIVLDKLKQLNSTQAVGTTIGFSLSVFLILSLIVCICLFCLKKGICCCQDKKASVEIAIQSQNTPLATQNVNETANQRAKRLVTTFLQSVERKSARGQDQDEHSHSSEQL